VRGLVAIVIRYDWAAYLLGAVPNGTVSHMAFYSAGSSWVNGMQLESATARREWWTLRQVVVYRCSIERAESAGAGRGRFDGAARVDAPTARREGASARGRRRVARVFFVRTLERIASHCRAYFARLCRRGARDRTGTRFGAMRSSAEGV